MTLTQLAIAVLLASLAFASSAAPGAPINQAVPFQARPLPLSAVRITGGPLKHAQELDAEYLLKLDIDRMMAFYRKQAGLEPKAAGYGGWDGPGKNLTGHIAGHYLSAVSYMYAATGDARFKERADRVVSELKEVQDKHGNGYLGALENGEQRFAQVAAGDIRSGGFDLNGLWSPWYVLHKTFAGLRDAYRLTGNRTALDLEVKFAGWAEGVLSKLDEAQTQKMLRTEFGGMNDVLADLYADTGDQRWLSLSDRFQHHAVIDPLSRHEDILGGLHGNTQVPKLLGSLTRYLYTGNKTDGDAALFFWDAVALHHSFATGGHGHDEYFGPPDKLSDTVDGRTCESCNVYNMLKMTRTLFALHPDPKYAEFEERALFNHVLGSIDPKDGRTCYMVPVGRAVRREYQDMFQSFTCCVGSGMESHALHGDGIYFESGDKLWVNLYVPSTATWESAGVHVAMETTFPEGETAALKLTVKSPKSFTLALRRPAWAGDGFSVSVNGRPIAKLPPAGSYVEIKRTWKTGDTVALVLPKALHEEAVPDNPRRVALLWGPLVLAGDLGPEGGRRRGTPTVSAPVLVAENQSPALWLKSKPGSPGEFVTEGVCRSPDAGDKPVDVTFMPFYRLQERTYAAYWDLYTQPEWDKKAAEIAAEQERQRKLSAATVSFVQPGEMQPERNFNQQGEDTQPDRSTGRPGRRGRAWFSYDMPVDPAHTLAVVVTYHSGERRKATFDILADGKPIGSQEISRTSPVHFFDVEYSLPAEVVKSKQKVTIRFQATKGNDIATVYGVRIIRADAQR